MVGKMLNSADLNWENVRYDQSVFRVRFLAYYHH